MKTQLNRIVIFGARSFGAGIMFTAGMALTALLAQTATAWTNGETLTATKLNAVVSDLNTLFATDARWTKNGTSAYYNAGNVGIGTTTPGAKLDIVGGDIYLDNGQAIFARQAGTPRRLIGTSGFKTTIRQQDNAATNAIAFQNFAGTIDLATIQENGNVGIGTTTPGSRLTVTGTTVTDDAPVMEVGSASTNTSGFVRFNMSGDTDRIGLWLSTGGARQRVWADDAGLLRVSSGSPTSNTNGTVVGDQTSTRDSKQDITDFFATEDLLAKLLGVRLHMFRYKHEVAGYKQNAKRKLGFLADEVDPLFMREFGTSVDQVSLNGILIGATQEQQKHINALRAQVASGARENAQLRERLARLETALAARGLLPERTEKSHAEVPPAPAAREVGLFRRALRYLW